ncbi:HNH endonuclease [Bizionia echini]|uniref:HNH endonuclease n=1 Tax=Bizionia echini TaxID=649333 RepID=A0A1I5DTQ4_9FLAO|nr:DUF262 domain-containing protein [Bizionia echini]SFO02629.1 HNH endonuclease [Bizionia echini]
MQENQLKENEEDNEILFDNEEPNEELELEDGQVAKIYTEKGDPEIHGLYGKYKRGKLDIQPDFQRYFVWDKAKSSRLIESALLGIPLPVIYLSEEQDGKIYVIDGQQRLTSFFSFIDGKLPDGTDFKLSGLKVLKDLNGKLFTKLDEEIRDNINDTVIRTITFKKESDTNLKFEIFERLNTGSVPLNTQELRNCIYRGEYNKLLKELAANEEYLELLNIKGPDKRMKDVELVLRFAAFYHNTHINYKSPIKTFLNNEMERFQNITSKDADNLRNAFKNAVSILKSVFGDRAFKRFYKGDENNPEGYWESKRFNVSLHDVLMDSFSRIDKNLAYQNLDKIREAFIDIMTTDDVFIDAIEIGTSEERKVKRRFNLWHSRLNEILEDKRNEPRCFSFQLKEELFKKNSNCEICNNKIQQIDDAAVDHIEQYWTGGKTIPENARLTHRHCNWSRPRKE